MRRGYRIESVANYQLGTFVEVPSRGFRSYDLLSDAEYEEYLEAERLVHRFLSDYQQFDEVRNSYIEYRNVVNHYSQKYSVKSRTNPVVSGEMNHAINRRLRTFFTEFYYFVEYAETKLKRQYGKDSEQAKEFKKATSEQFDNSFAYRFVYHLRHYAQHINLPINALSLQSGEFDFLTATTNYNLLVETNRDELLNSGFDWRARDIRPQLRSLPPKFELNTYIEEMMECLEKVYVVFVSIGLPDAKRGAAHIKNLVEPIGSRGRPCVYHLDVPENVTPSQVVNFVTGVSWIQIELAEFVANLPDPATFRQLPAFKVDIGVQS